MAPQIDEPTSNMETNTTHQEIEEETLRIAINREMPTKPVPGTENLFFYWKIAFHENIAKAYIEMYVPSEWRSINYHRLSNWVAKLQDSPCEDIILGCTKYHWLPNALVPYGQNLSKIPLPPGDGKPELIWRAGHTAHSNGKKLPIRVNRRIPTPCARGLEKIFCYWVVRLPGNNQRNIWVAPEWRKLSPGILKDWLHALSRNEGKDITLGGVRYRWAGNNILPYDQREDQLEALGYGDFAHCSDDETEEQGTSRENLNNSLPIPSEEEQPETSKPLTNEELSNIQNFEKNEWRELTFKEREKIEKLGEAVWGKRKIPEQEKRKQRQQDYREKEERLWNDTRLKPNLPTLPENASLNNDARFQRESGPLPLTRYDKEEISFWRKETSV